MEEAVWGGGGGCRDHSGTVKAMLAVNTKPRGNARYVVAKLIVYDSQSRNKITGITLRLHHKTV